MRTSKSRELIEIFVKNSGSFVTELADDGGVVVTVAHEVKSFSLHSSTVYFGS